MPECFKSGGFFSSNILCALNHETRRGERDGDLMTANRQDRRGGTVSPISSLCGTLLSDNRSCTTPDLSHVLLVAWRATQDNGDVFSCVCVLFGARESERVDIYGRVHFVLVFLTETYVCCISSYPFLCLSRACVRRRVRVCVCLLHNQSMKACAVSL